MDKHRCSIRQYIVRMDAVNRKVVGWGSLGRDETETDNPAGVAIRVENTATDELIGTLPPAVGGVPEWVVLSGEDLADG